MDGIKNVAHTPQSTGSKCHPNPKNTTTTRSQVVGSVKSVTPQSKGSSMSVRTTTPTEEQLFALIKEGRNSTTLANGEASGLALNKKQGTPTATTDARAIVPTTKIGTSSLHHTATEPPRQGGASASSHTERVTPQEKRKRVSTRTFLSLTRPPENNIAPSSPELQFLPEKIVLLIDKQDSYLKSFSHRNVLHIYDTKLNFRNAFDMIMKTNYTFKNTLFVVLCGTMSALKQDINDRCHLFQCKEPLYNYAIQEFKAPSLQEHLIKEAKTLRTMITAMENCDVIFSGVLPVRLDRAEAYEAARHYSQTGHQVRVNNSKCEMLYGALCSGLKEFNRWAKDDAAFRGFPNWSLVDMFTVEDSSKHFTDLTKNSNNSTEDSSSHHHSKHPIKNTSSSSPLEGNGSSLIKNNNDPTKSSNSFSQCKESPTEGNSTPNCLTQCSTSHQHFMHPTQADGVTLTGECMVKRRHVLKTKLKETFLMIKKVKQTQKPPSPSVADDNKNNKVAVVVPKVESSCPATPSHPGAVKSTVVVLCDSMHKRVLSALLSHWIFYEKVTLIGQDNLTSSSIADIVQSHYSQVSLNNQAKWIFCFGITDFVDISINPQCLEQQCRMSLQCLSVQKGDTWLNIDDKVQETISKVMKFKSQLKWVLPDTTVVMAPPMQLAVLNGEVFKDHAKLHRAAIKHNLFISNRATYDFIKKFCPRLFDAWLYTFVQLEGGTFIKAIVDYITKYKYQGTKLIDEDLAYVKKFGKEWPGMMDSLVTTCHLLGVHRSSFISSMTYITHIESSPNIGKTVTFDLPEKTDKEDQLFQQVVVMGDQMPVELELLCYKLSIHIVPERVTFDEAGKALILKYQKHWPKGTLWVILSDVLHLATCKTLPVCVKARCEQRLKAYNLDIPNPNRKRQRKKVCALKKPNISDQLRWDTYAKLKITNVISRAKAFCESLMDGLGDGSAVLLPPVTPVYIIHMHTGCKHEAWHQKYASYWNIPIVTGGKKKWSKCYFLMKRAWLEMVKPYLKCYPELTKTLNLYCGPNQDWIRNLGNFLVYFATATMDDAEFSDAEFSSGEEDIMEEVEEEIEYFVAPSPFQHASTSAAFPASSQHLSTPSSAYISKEAPASVPANFSHPIPPASALVRQDVHVGHGIPTARVTGDTIESASQRTLLMTPKDTPGTSVRMPRRVTGNTTERAPKRTLLKTPKDTSGTPVRVLQRVTGDTTERDLLMTAKDTPGTPVRMPQRVTGDTTDRAPQRTQLRTPKDTPGTPLRIPQRVTGNTTERAPQRTLLKTPKDTPGTPVRMPQRVTGNTTERAPKRTLLKTPKETPGTPVRVPQMALLKPQLKTPVQQQQQVKEAGVMGTVQGPQQAVKEKDQRTSMTGKGQEALSRDGVQITLREKNSQATCRTAHGTPRKETIPMRQHNSTTERSPVIVRTKKGQESPRKKKVQQPRRTEKGLVTVRMDKKSESSRKVKGQSLSRTEKGQVTVKAEQSQDDTIEESQVRMESGKKLQRRVTKNGDAKMSDDESNGSWIILSETEEGDGDSLRKKENPDYSSSKDCSKEDSLSSSEQEIVSEKKESISNHSKDTTTTSGTLSKQQSLVPEAKNSLSNSEQEIVSERRSFSDPNKDTTTLGTLTKAKSLVPKAKDSLSSGEQEAVSERRESCSDLSKDTTTTSKTPAKRQSLVSEAKDALCNHNENTTTTETPVKKHSLVLKAKGLLNKDIKDGNTSSALCKHSNDTTTTTVLDQHSRDYNTTSTEVPYLHESLTKHSKDDICEQNVLTDPNYNEDSRDTEVLSNPDSVETIPLSESELVSRNLDVPDEYSFIKFGATSDLPQENFMIKAQNFGKCDVDNVTMEREPVVGGGPGGAAGEGNPLKRKRKLSSPDRSSPTFSSSINISFDTDLEKLFRMLEDNLNEEHQLKWQTYQQVPEVHPDFQDKHTEFLKLFKESNEGKAPEDPEHCERAWGAFWEDTLKKQLYEEWESGRKLLVERFKTILRSRSGEDPKKSISEESLKSSSSSSGESQPKRLKVDEDRKENCTFEDSSGNKNNQSSPRVIQKEKNPKSLLQSCSSVIQENSPLPPNVTRENSKAFIQSSPSVNEKEESESLPLSQNAAEKAESNNPLSPGSCLTDMSHYKQLIEKATKTTDDKETGLHKHSPALSTDRFMEDETKRRVCLILDTFAMLTELGRSLGTLAPAVVPIIKKVLDKGVYSNEAVRVLGDKDNALVMKLCSERLRQLGEKAKGAYRDRLLQCSSDTAELIENVSSSLESIEALEGLDILSIAKATAWQDTAYILQFIKSTLARKGVDAPSESILSELFMAVSSHHFIMAIQNSPAAEAAAALPDPGK